jgi:hypothetical protein
VCPYSSHSIEMVRSLRRNQRYKLHIALGQALYSTYTLRVRFDDSGISKTHSPSPAITLANILLLALGPVRITFTHSIPQTDRFATDRVLQPYLQASNFCFSNRRRSRELISRVLACSVYYIASSRSAWYFTSEKSKPITPLAEWWFLRYRRSLG